MHGVTYTGMHGVTHTNMLIISFHHFPRKLRNFEKIDRRIRDSLSREEVADPRSPAAVEEPRQERGPKQSRRDTRSRCPSACHHQDVRSPPVRSSCPTDQSVPSKTYHCSACAPSPSPSPLLLPSSHPPTPSALPPSRRLSSSTT